MHLLRAALLTAALVVLVGLGGIVAIHALAISRPANSAKVIALTCADARTIHDQVGTAVDGLTRPGLRTNYRFVAGRPSDVPPAERAAFATYLGPHPTRASAAAVDAWIERCSP